MNNEATDSIKKTRWWRKLIFLITICLIVASGAFYIIRVGSAPSVGKVVDSKTLTTNNVPTVSTETLNTPFYTLEYSSKYKLQAGLTKGGGQLDLQVLQKHSDKSDPGAIRATLGVELLPAGGAQQMSHYNLAKAFPESYKIETMEGEVEKSYQIFKYDDGSSKILLIPHGKYVLVMALAAQSTGVQPDYDEFIRQSTRTLIWK